MNLFDNNSRKLALMTILASALVGACITEILVIFLGMGIAKAIFIGQLSAYAGLSVFGLTGALILMVMDVY